MPKNEPKTTIGMVCAILYRELGLFYSLRELSEMIREEYYCIIKYETIRSAIDEINTALPLITVKNERRGVLKHPTFLFSIEKQF